MKPKNSTTLLPQSLLDKIKENDGESRVQDTTVRLGNLNFLLGDHSVGHSKKRGGPSRKDARKQAREDKKLRNAEHHASRSRANSAVVAGDIVARPTKRAAQSTVEEGNSRKRPRISGEDSLPRSKPQNQENPILDPPKTRKILKAASSASIVTKPKPLPTSINTSVAPKSSIERAEEKQIAWLESQLGIKKKSKSGKYRYGADFAEDGLDGMLSFPL